ncbi:radical SAM protein [Methanoplanus limicola]|uniref:Radical SAM domain protein n=1 Tax=Methanoplanus limicola DSM 2279 TaxID=937775 RepID=H1Z4E8_9EURY|nr:radical SAM protein [Methanoplanus limicola]EHQ36696.1 Radical SAM domain protein [Methanoplanus limicola DSM 2279]
MIHKFRKYLNKYYGLFLIRGYIPPKPISLNIFTTRRCNFSCNYCSRNLSINSSVFEGESILKSDFKIEGLKKILIKYPSIRSVSFVGVGEPFLVKDIIEMASLAKKSGKKTSVVTNGSLLHRYFGQIGASFDSISVSLHGLNPDDFSKTTGVDSLVFKQIEKNM